MKKLTLLSISFVFAISAYSQKLSKENVPATVKSTFAAKFPKATAESWEIDFENYEVEFKLDKTEMGATFDKDGVWMETETPIKSSALPKLVKEAIKKEFGELTELKLTDCEKVESKEKVTYELVVAKGENKYELVISESGEILKKETAEKN